jgi:D-sedoheptulose 7-phosphate isomerase
MIEYIKKIINDSIDLKKGILEKNVQEICDLTKLIISAYKKDKKIVVFGNGGSAADAQHLVGELVVRFEKDRRSLSAVALTTNTSILTSIINDYGYKGIFSKQIESIVKSQDVVIGISTSGNSENVLEGIRQAKSQGAITVGFTGKDGGKMKSLVDNCICVPSGTTARIQEGHILIIHIICGLIEQELFK